MRKDCEDAQGVIRLGVCRECGGLPRSAGINESRVRVSLAFYPELCLTGLPGVYKGEDDE